MITLHLVICTRRDRSTIRVSETWDRLFKHSIMFVPDTSAMEWIESPNALEVNKYSFCVVSIGFYGLQLLNAIVMEFFSYYPELKSVDALHCTTVEEAMLRIQARSEMEFGWVKKKPEKTEKTEKPDKSDDKTQKATKEDFEAWLARKRKEPKDEEN